MTSQPSYPDLREALGSPVLDDELSEHHYQSLDAVAAWAAFYHQGNARP